MPGKYNILLMGASYGSLLASKILFGGHRIHLVCLPAEADLINAEGFRVRLPVKGSKEQVVLDSRDEQGRGLLLTTAAEGMLRFAMSDGVTSFTWASDARVLGAGKLHHVTVSVDGGPKMLTFVIDDRLCDGGDDPQRPFGTG